MRPFEAKRLTGAQVFETGPSEGDECQWRERFWCQWEAQKACEVANTPSANW